MADQEIEIPNYFTVVVLTTATTGEPIYEARHPELPRCMGQGDTVEEAEIDLREATVFMLEYYAEKGLPIPKPAKWATPGTSRDASIDPPEIWRQLFTVPLAMPA